MRGQQLHFRGSQAGAGVPDVNVERVRQWLDLLKTLPERRHIRRRAVGVSYLDGWCAGGELQVCALGAVNILAQSRRMRTAECADWLALTTPQTNWVVDLNDEENMSFRAIADRLEFEWAHELTGDRYRWT